MNIYAFLLTTIAGLSTMIGTIFIFIKRKNINNIIVSALSFAAGVMSCVSIIDLIPSSINEINNTFKTIPTILLMLIFVVIGIIISMTINKYLPSENTYIKDNKNLYRVGIISMIAIILHNIPEGIATYITSDNNINVGISLTLAIAMHNIPEGISISIPIYYSTKSRLKAIFYTFISALSEPIGAIITYLFLQRYINNTIIGFLYAIIAGIMLHISIYELLPSAKKYNQKSRLKLYFLIGIFFMLINHLIFG